MTTGLAARTVAVWFVLLGLAVANGALREAVLIPRLGRTPGLMLSGVLLAAAIVAVAWASLPWLRVRGTRASACVGLVWLVLTVVFEFAFGAMRGKALPALLEAYTFKDGNLWPAVLLVTAAAPWLAAKLRDRR